MRVDSCGHKKGGFGEKEANKRKKRLSFFKIKFRFQIKTNHSFEGRPDLCTGTLLLLVSVVAVVVVLLLPVLPSFSIFACTIAGKELPTKLALEEVSEALDAQRKSYPEEWT